uniref:Glycosyltransferase n=1 Tax=Linum usitatissimum TaxID=4006 RepID=I2BHD2_LINUS|nr:UDP-glycosyltransferase 1 [Linum usitatissimum]
MENTNRHAVIFPFMAKGHVIPLLHFARLLLRRQIHVTVVTTPANRSFVAEFLGGHNNSSAAVVTIPFPQGIHRDIPPGVESTDKLPSMSLFPTFAISTKLMQPHFELALASLRPVDFLVSDGFLGWTLDSANKFGIPRLVFYGISCYASCVCKSVGEGKLLARALSDHDPVTLPEFPWIQVTKQDFEPPFDDPEAKGAYFDFHLSCFISTANSFGLIINGFYELEPLFVDHLNRHALPKAWCVGPFFLAQPNKKGDETDHYLVKPYTKPTWIEWLDRNLREGIPVLYVAFGSQSEISSSQLKEIAQGLHDSGVKFLWVTRSHHEPEAVLGGEFEARVKDQGMIVREWVDQREILVHPSVQGFLSHCGWNSMMEAMSAGVPILAWPMLAEQPLNARMVSEEIKVGIRVESCDGSVKGFVRSEGLSKMVKELMEGEKGKEVRKRAKEYGEMARKAMEEGSGSSWRNLDLLLGEIFTAKI